MLNEATHVDAQLSFSRVEDVSAEADGGLRARTLSPEALADPESYAPRRCRILDCSAAGGLRPELGVHGFGHVDLSQMQALQAMLERVRVAGRLEDRDAGQIRRHLMGRALPLVGGGQLRVLYPAREGFFMRRAGPNRMKMGDGSRMGLNGHDAALAVHADQDVDGTPLRQLLRGAAPWLFRHDSPGGSNTRSRLALVNLWIPLDQVTRPLALMDRRTLDRRAHQLRHGMPTTAFLRRREDMRVNDVWTFLPDEAQRWYFTSEMDARTAYVFETLSTPHGSFVAPGEAAAAAMYRQITAAAQAVARADAGALARALAELDVGCEAGTRASLRRALAAMARAIAEARADPSALIGGEGGARWVASAVAAADRVVRKSLEMRAVAWLSPARASRGRS